MRYRIPYRADGWQRRPLSPNILWQRISMRLGHQQRLVVEIECVASLQEIAIRSARIEERWPLRYDCGDWRIVKRLRPWDVQLMEIPARTQAAC